VTEIREETRIPLKLLPSGQQSVPFFAVQAQCKDRNLLLLVDTGTSVTLLRNTHQERMKLKQVSQAETNTQGSPTLSVFSSSSLRLGEFHLEGETVAFLSDDQFDSLERETGVPVDGFLGATLLRRGEVEFNVPDKMLVIRPFDRSEVEDSPFSVPFVSIPDSNGYVIPLKDRDGSQGRFLLDTGTNAALTLATDCPLGQAAQKAGASGYNECRSLQGKHTFECYPLPAELTLPGYAFRKGLRVYLVPEVDPRIEGTVGMPVFLDSNRVLLNHKLQLAAFEPADGGSVENQGTSQ
jgi:hypothetical protein